MTGRETGCQQYRLGVDWHPVLVCVELHVWLPAVFRESLLSFTSWSCLLHASCGVNPAQHDHTHFFI